MSAIRSLGPVCVLHNWRAQVLSEVHPCKFLWKVLPQQVLTHCEATRAVLWFVTQGLAPWTSGQAYDTCTAPV